MCPSIDWSTRGHVGLLDDRVYRYEGVRYVGIPDEGWVAVSNDERVATVSGLA